MARGRKPLPPPQAPVEINEAVVRGDLIAADTLAAMRLEANDNAQALAVQLGYEGSLTVGSLEDEIRFFQRRTAEACIELGKRMLILKELTPHGEFLERLTLLGVGKSTAYRFMQAARKFSKLPKLGHLAIKPDSAGKFLELLVLDDDELEALDKGGSALGIKLDDVDCMSATELRTALREAKAEATAKDRVIEARARRETELEKSLARIQVQPPDEALAALRQHLSNFAIAVEFALSGQLMPAAQAILAHHSAHGGDSREVLEGALRQVERMTASVRAECGLPGGPAWEALSA